jgi:ABC-type transport system involved in multi-copper enzyme maturation permease subunit
MIIWAIAKTTMGDALRKKILQVFLVVAIGLIVMSFSFSSLSGFSTRSGAGTDLLLVKSFGMGLIALVGALMSLVMGVSLIPQEIERRTIYTVLSKPVKRYEFIIGKYLGATLTLAVNIFLMGIVFLVAVTLKAHWAVESLTATLPEMELKVSDVQVFDVKSVLGVVMIFLQFTVLSSVVLFFSVFLTPTVNFFMGMGVYVIGLLSTVTKTIAEAGEQGLTTPVIFLYKVLHIVMPNFDKYNITNSLLHSSEITNLTKYTIGMIIYSLIYSLVMMLLAIITFERKEV